MDGFPFVSDATTPTIKLTNFRQNLEGPNMETANLMSG